METTENLSASVELTSTLTDSNDATQILTGDSVPSSSSDANLGSSYSKTIQDDPISSTSDSVSGFNFSDEKEDFFSSDLNIENIRTEKINEDVEDIANDLENLLGETSNDFLIPTNKDKGVSISPTNVDENNDNSNKIQEVDSTDKKYVKNDKQDTENIKLASTLQDNTVDTKASNDFNSNIEVCKVIDQPETSKVSEKIQDDKEINLNTNEQDSNLDSVNLQKESATLHSTSCAESNVSDNSISEKTNLENPSDIKLSESVKPEIKSQDECDNNSKNVIVEVVNESSNKDLEQNKIEEVSNLPKKDLIEDKKNNEVFESNTDIKIVNDVKECDVAVKSKVEDESENINLKNSNQEVIHVEETQKEITEPLEIKDHDINQQQCDKEKNKNVENVSKDDSENDAQTNLHPEEVQNVINDSEKNVVIIKKDQEVEKLQIEVENVEKPQIEVENVKKPQIEAEDVQKCSKEVEEKVIIPKENQEVGEQNEKSEKIVENLCEVNEAQEKEVQETNESVRIEVITQSALLPEASLGTEVEKTLEEKNKDGPDIELVSELKENKIESQNQTKTEENHPETNSILENSDELNRKSEDVAIVEEVESPQVESKSSQIETESSQSLESLKKDTVLQSSDDIKESDEKIEEKKVALDRNEGAEAVEIPQIQLVELSQSPQSSDDSKSLKAGPVLQQSSDENDQKIENANVQFRDSEVIEEEESQLTEPTQSVQEQIEKSNRIEDVEKIEEDKPIEEVEKIEVEGIGDEEIKNVHPEANTENIHHDTQVSSVEVSHSVSDDKTLSVEIVSEPQKSVKMTISSIIEEAIQDEEQSSNDKVEILKVPETIENVDDEKIEDNTKIANEVNTHSESKHIESSVSLINCEEIVLSETVPTETVSSENIAADNVESAKIESKVLPETVCIQQEIVKDETKDDSVTKDDSDTSLKRENPVGLPENDKAEIVSLQEVERKGEANIETNIEQQEIDDSESNKVENTEIQYDSTLKQEEPKVQSEKVSLDLEQVETECQENINRNIEQQKVDVPESIKVETPQTQYDSTSKGEEPEVQSEKVSLNLKPVENIEQQKIDDSESITVENTDVQYGSTLKREESEIQPEKVSLVSEQVETECEENIEQQKVDDSESIKAETPQIQCESTTKQDDPKVVSENVSLGSEQVETECGENIEQQEVDDSESIKVETPQIECDSTLKEKENPEGIIVNTETSFEVSKANAESKISFKSDDSELKQHEPENVSEINETISEISENIPEINENIPEINENIPEINENVSEITDKISEITENISEIADNTPVKSENIESYNRQTETVTETVRKPISIIPDSLDEGNIAALAICEPSNMEYYQIEDDLTSHTSDNKSTLDNEVVQEFVELQHETGHIEERSKYPTADETEVIATAAALTANKNDEKNVEKVSEQPQINEEIKNIECNVNDDDVNKDNLEIQDIEEEKPVIQSIIETPKKSRNKSTIEQIPSQTPSQTSSQTSSQTPSSSSETTSQTPSQSCSQIQPLVIDVETPVEEKEEVLTPQYSSKMSTKEVLKLTITKHKIDSPKEEDSSILKIYDPKEDKKSQKKEVIPKLIIKPVRSQSPQDDDQEQTVPKLLIRNMSPNRPCSPKVAKIQKNETSTSLKVTIKPVVKTIKNDEETFTPKITIKPIVKPEEEISHSKISPRITIKPLIRPDDDVLKEEERSHSPRVTIKPIKGDDGKVLSDEMVHSPRITIKPIKPPDDGRDEECSPKITIKPLIKPQEEDRHEKKEGSPKIKIKPIVKPVEEQLEVIDFEEQIKQERIVLKINTKESRKREASEDIEKLAKIKLKFSKEGGHAHIVSDQKLKRSSEQSSESDTKRLKIDTVDVPSFSEKDVIEIKDDSNPLVEDPIDAIPTFQINTQPQNQNVQTQNVQNSTVSSPVVVPTPPPRKRGRPRKIPLVVREDFKDAKEEEPEVTPVVEDTGRPKRSCRGPSVCTTLGIKPRKPRGGGAGTRGRGRGRGSRGGSRGGNRQQRVTTRSKLLLEEEIVETSDYRRRLVVDEIIEIPDDDPKEEEHPSQPLPPTHHQEVIEVITRTSPDDTGNTESVASEKVPSDGGSDVVLIEEETRMSADIHSSRAYTPAKQVADIDDTQSSVQSTATTESVKVRKGSRLEVHPEQDDIISPDQLAEYYWGGSGPYMIQEQVAQFLGIKSFKRKYPGIQRRPVDMQERDFIREGCLASEPMCDMGLTAVASADILDIMYSDFQPKYEEYCKHQRDRHTKEIINKQKALSLVLSQEKSKHDLTQQAMQSAASWNLSFNRTRREERRACMDLQTFTINYPKGRFKTLDKGKVGSYPIALVPGQYTDHYKEYSPNELYNLPLNTMMNQTLSIVRDDDSQSDGSASDSDTTSSDSDTSSSDSSDDDCNLCTSQVGSRKVSAN